jgi:hypothetical protein
MLVVKFVTASRVSNMTPECSRGAASTDASVNGLLVNDWVSSCVRTEHHPLVGLQQSVQQLAVGQAVLQRTVGKLNAETGEIKP